MKVFNIYIISIGFHIRNSINRNSINTVSYTHLDVYKRQAGHHVGYETTIIYLHVLDVIWLFLYVLFYWWGV